jgi:hypothetical protein
MPVVGWGVWETRQRTRIALEAQAALRTESSQGSTFGAATPEAARETQGAPDHTLVLLERIAAALESQAQQQSRGRGEQFVNFLAQVAVVVGAVIALAGLLRR